MRAARVATRARAAPEGEGAREPARRPARGLLALALLASGCLAPAAFAEPMDLANREARWVAVRFEVSPHDRPGQVDAVYSAPLVARLEPSESATEVRLTIAGRVVEEQLLRDHDPVPGSFSDFVWAFDTATGHVLSATVSGTVVRMLDWGPWRSAMEAQVRVRVDTRGPAGFERVRRLLGQEVHPFCAPGRRDECQAVHPTAYEPATGYVNAVGPLDVETRLMRLRTFATLGEAIFSELEPAAHDRWAALASDAVPEPGG